MEQGTPVIAVDGLSKSFGNHYALRNVNFTVKEGEFLTIFGPNGAGKTTLIRILSNITKASTGQITIGGFLLDREPEKIRRRIGVIAHQTFLYEDLTAEENLRFYAKLYDVNDLDHRIETLLTEVGLAHRRTDRVRTFSRGMQQRLSIARAMLHDPTLLLLDEPYTGLDQHAAAMLSGWLKRLRDSHRTTLMVTHDLEQGVDLADRVAILVKGRLVYDHQKSEIDLKNFRPLYNDLVDRGKQ
ncbi:heme ABC exporter ATP-binding protein CcmA [candidate division KSB1 bacterium]|nr:heme ABC exporter ATP-binding protein CcmA [candidate division KSB1 bacterium]NIR73330.1 heme ABC exporter ATP-binding protein CcmA [candidate division KSB1 bacterium]NIS27036.1 heme ABC exporter ATP-binding protein CcmA [candidate division KSB1 bacterium]NIT73876.1 heme ABC exporter ATP-binding protein CcmA [candidate division KSB1 bacterium]NIU27781.1 heme ABC exporter ATP-binding protein CcmA [candidate division KSB1 bacterium]